MSWFESLFGFRESADRVRAHLTVEGDRLRSSANGATYGCGRLSTPSLAALRESTHAAAPNTLREVVGDVRRLHADPANAGAVIQAASQFNLLEMVGPSVTPEAGVTGYQNDRTQGPICAISCGAGTVYRNWFVPLDGQLGQTADRQIDCLADLGDALGNQDASLWAMRNGYAMLTEHGKRTLPERLGALDEPARDALRARLRIGVHADVEVTAPRAGHHLTQVYGSALPVAYGGGPTAAWEALARIVLEASYEATLRAAAANAAATGNRTVFLTLLGGGVFGNPIPWIVDAIDRAVRVVPAGLDVAVVSYGSSTPAVAALARALR